VSLTIRAYNVLFGDCLLVSWDEADGEHHAWIDFGNFHNDPNAVFTSVYDNVLQRTNGKLDLVVITHRHMDHLEGFYSLRDRFAADFKIDRIWYAHVTPSLDNQFQIAGQAIRELAPRKAWMGDGILGRIYRNNFGAQALTIIDRMNSVLNTLRYTSAHPVHRESNMAHIMPDGLDRLKIEILAPEQDSSIYLEPLHDALGFRPHLDAYFKGATSGTQPSNVEDDYVRPMAQKAIDSPLMQLADFARLRRKLRTGGLNILAAADKTRNNTSVVLALTYRGKRLLLTGDAEEKSWQIMRQKGLDLSSRLIKVAHHGSINASPCWSYRAVLTRRRKSNAVIVSTEPTRYTGKNEVPKEEVLDGWRDRLSVQERLKTTDGVLLGSYEKITF
jgi:hypothetical protein